MIRKGFTLLALLAAAAAVEPGVAAGKGGSFRLQLPATGHVELQKVTFQISAAKRVPKNPKIQLKRGKPFPLSVISITQVSRTGVSHGGRTASYEAFFLTTAAKEPRTRTLQAALAPAAIPLTFRAPGRKLKVTGSPHWSSDDVYGASMKAREKFCSGLTSVRSPVFADVDKHSLRWTDGLISTLIDVGWVNSCAAKPGVIPAQIVEQIEFLLSHARVHYDINGDHVLGDPESPVAVTERLVVAGPGTGYTLWSLPHGGVSAEDNFAPAANGTISGATAGCPYPHFNGTVLGNPDPSPTGCGWGPVIVVGKQGDPVAWEIGAALNHEWDAYLEDEDALDAYAEVSDAVEHLNAAIGLAHAEQASGRLSAQAANAIIAALQQAIGHDNQALDHVVHGDDKDFDSEVLNAIGHKRDALENFPPDVVLQGLGPP